MGLLTLAAALGFFAIAAQSLLFRDFLTAFEGNELAVGIFFGTWFLWVAVGALAARRSTRLATFLPALAMLYVPACVLEHYLILAARTLTGVASYDIFPFGRMLAASLLTSAPVSLLTGFLFALACQRAEGRTGKQSAQPVAHVYLCETLGAAAGGIAVTLLLFQSQSLHTPMLAAALVLAAGVATAARGRVLRFVPLAALLTMLLMGWGDDWSHYDARRAWTRLMPAETYQGRFATPHAEYTFGEREGQFVIVSSGSVCEALPDTGHAAEVLATTLSQCPKAERILVAGPGALAICLEFAKLPQVNHVAWMHTDQTFDKAAMHPLSKWVFKKQAGLQIALPGSFRHLESNAEPYDLVVLHLPQASTLALNRYSTRELFARVRENLTPRGVLAVRMAGGANYLGGELAYLGASMLATVERVFEQTALKPGDETWLLAGGEEAKLSESPALLRDRFALIPGADAVFPAKGLMSLYLPDRIAYQRAKYREVLERAPPESLVNTSEHPKALFYALLVLLRQSGVRGLTESLPSLGRILPVFTGLVALLYVVLRMLYRWRGQRSAHVPCGVRQLAAAARRAVRFNCAGNALSSVGQTRDTQNGLRSEDAAASGRTPHGAAPSSSAPPAFDAAFLVASTGTAGMALSIALMYRFQAQTGNLFLYVGLLSAQFMLGSFAGGALCAGLLRWRSREPSLLLPGLLALHLLALAGMALLPDFGDIRHSFRWFAIAGFFTGVYFPVAAHRMREAGREAMASGAALETMDHAGAAVGAVVTGSLLLPLLGVPVTVGLVALLVLANIPALFRRSEPERDEDRFDRLSRPTGYVLAGVGILFVACSNYAALLHRADSAGLLADSIREMTGAAEITEVSSESGRRYFTVTGENATPWHCFSTADWCEGQSGYGGPIDLALTLQPDGALRDLHVLTHHETPAYMRLVAPWLEELPGTNLLEPDPWRRIDAVSGATITAQAIQRNVQESATAFAVEVLGMPPPEGAEQTPTPTRRTDALWLAAFLAGAVALRYRPGKWRRRAFLLASLGILGLWLNLQYATHHAVSLLGLQTPPWGFTAPFLMVAVVPAAVILFGNVYCGYICPFGTLQELLRDLLPKSLRRDPGKEVWRYGRAVKYLLLALLVLLFALTRDHAVLSADPLTTIFGEARTPTILALAAAAVVLAVPFGRFWCRNLCPAGAFLALLGSLRLLRKLTPTTIPARCDLGVRTPRELDCIHCDRCRHEDA